MNKKIISRVLFWTIYSFALVFAIQDGWWLWLLIVSPILIYIFYKDELQKISKSRKK